MNHVINRSAREEACFLFYVNRKSTYVCCDLYRRRWTRRWTLIFPASRVEFLPCSSNSVHYELRDRIRRIVVLIFIVHDFDDALGFAISGRTPLCQQYQDLPGRAIELEIVSERLPLLDLRTSGFEVVFLLEVVGSHPRWKIFWTMFLPTEAFFPR